MPSVSLVRVHIPRVSRVDPCPQGVAWCMARTTRSTSKRAAKRNDTVERWSCDQVCVNSEVTSLEDHAWELLLRMAGAHAASGESSSSELQRLAVEARRVLAAAPLEMPSVSVARTSATSIDEAMCAVTKVRVSEGTRASSKLVPKASHFPLSDGLLNEAPEEKPRHARWLSDVPGISGNIEEWESEEEEEGRGCTVA
uniref:Uncharacterized protein n=1 Tax=Noctiluca scintillans TaxID=2966 RepID=A0A7S1FGY6_NOCSC